VIHAHLIHVKMVVIVCQWVIVLCVHVHQDLQVKNVI